jgi:hypothetical protein
MRLPIKIVKTVVCPSIKEPVDIGKDCIGCINYRGITNSNQLECRYEARMECNTNKTEQQSTSS